MCDFVFELDKCTWSAKTVSIESQLTGTACSAFYGLEGAAWVTIATVPVEEGLCYSQTTVGGAARVLLMRDPVFNYAITCVLEIEK